MANKKPSWRFRDERKYENEKEKGRDWGDDVEWTPWMVEVWDDWEENGANGEKIEGGGADGGSFRRADRFSGEDEGGDARTSDAYAGEEAEEGVKVEGWS